MAEVGRCPLCGWDARIENLGDADNVKCALCGEFKITASLRAVGFAHTDPSEENPLLPYLRAHTRQASERRQGVTLDTNNWRDFALAHEGTPCSRRVQKVLDLVASRCEPGTRGKIEIHADAPLVGVNSDHQFSYILRYLEESGYLVQHGGVFYELTPD